MDWEFLLVSLGIQTRVPTTWDSLRPSRCTLLEDHPSWLRAGPGRIILAGVKLAVSKTLDPLYLTGISSRTGEGMDKGATNRGQLATTPPTLSQSDLCMSSIQPEGMNAR